MSSLQIVKIYKSFRRLLMEKVCGLQFFQEAVGLLKIGKRRLLREGPSSYHGLQVFQEAVKGKRAPSYYGLQVFQEAVQGKRPPADYVIPQVVQAAVKRQGFLKIMVYKPFRRLLMEKAS
jgi:hypothetical protein